MKKERQTTDVKSLKKQIIALNGFNGACFDEAVCDIIDLRGCAVALLLDKIESFSDEKQLRMAKKIEDYIYFHPERGRKILKRFKKAMRFCAKTTLPHLLSAFVDVCDTIENSEVEMSDVSDLALSVLCLNSDLSRSDRALTILEKTHCISATPYIIENMIIAASRINGLPSYQFIEKSLLVLKSFVGDPLLRMLIDPNSSDALKQMRFFWRDQDAALFENILSVLSRIDSNFSQTVLKVIELSEFNIPFVSMINEGLSHSDKWVRQAAVMLMEKASKELDVETLTKMLRDPAPEVRLMAVSSLGAFPKDVTGTLLYRLATSEGDPYEMRLNALYALHAQKNIDVLKNLEFFDSTPLLLHARCLSALLMPKEDGTRLILQQFASLSVDMLSDVVFYYLERTEPEDILDLINYYNDPLNQSQRENLLELIQRFLAAKAGPRLQTAISRLPEANKKALALLTPAEV